MFNLKSFCIILLSITLFSNISYGLSKNPWNELSSNNAQNPITTSSSSNQSSTFFNVPLSQNNSDNTLNSLQTNNNNATFFSQLNKLINSAIKHLKKTIDTVVKTLR